LRPFRHACVSQSGLVNSVVRSLKCTANGPLTATPLSGAVIDPGIDAPMNHCRECGTSAASNRSDATGDRRCAVV